MTVTNQNLFALDTEAESAKGYVYGSGSTVRLVLDGESLFLRSWTKDLMPQTVKINLGLVAGATPNPAASSAPPMGGGMMGRPPGMGGMPFGPGGFQPPNR